MKCTSSKIGYTTCHNTTEKKKKENQIAAGFINLRKKVQSSTINRERESQIVKCQGTHKDESYKDEMKFHINDEQKRRPVK